MMQSMTSLRCAAGDRGIVQRVLCSQQPGGRLCRIFIYILLLLIVDITRPQTLCVGVATADSPVGQYVDLGACLVYTVGMGEIDPHFFKDDDGQNYLIWKTGHSKTCTYIIQSDTERICLIIDGNAVGQPTPIWIQPLSANGTVRLGSQTQMISDTLRM